MEDKRDVSLLRGLWSEILTGVNVPAAVDNSTGRQTSARPFSYHHSALVP